MNRIDATIIVRRIRFVDEPVDLSPYFAMYPGIEPERITGVVAHAFKLDEALVTVQYEDRTYFSSVRVDDYCDSDVSMWAMDALRRHLKDEELFSSLIFQRALTQFVGRLGAVILDREIES